MPVLFVEQTPDLKKYIEGQVPEIQDTMTQLLNEGRIRELSQYINGVLKVEQDTSRRKMLVDLISETDT